ncbi:MAG: HAD family hydrolase [Microcystaceae cyanobacterium]
MVVQGVLIDVDGTLVLSNDAHAQAWVDAFAVYGYEIPFEKVRPMIGMGGNLVIPKLVPGLNDQQGDGKALLDYRKQLVIKQFGSKLSPANGSRELILKMLESGLKLIIASSAQPEELEILLKAAQVDDLLPEATTSGDADNSKPAPDIVEAALKKIQMEPNQVIMLGDTPYDIESAGKAGVDVIAVRCGGFPEAELSKAIALYDDPADLLRQYDSSPLASREAI